MNSFYSIKTAIEYITLSFLWQRDFLNIDRNLFYSVCFSYLFLHVVLYFSLLTKIYFKVIIVFAKASWFFSFLSSHKHRRIILSFRQLIFFALLKNWTYQRKIFYSFKLQFHLLCKFFIDLLYLSITKVLMIIFLELIWLNFPLNLKLVLMVQYLNLIMFDKFCLFFTLMSYECLLFFFLKILNFFWLWEDWREMNK